MRGQRPDISTYKGLDGNNSVYSLVSFCLETLAEAAPTPVLSIAEGPPEGGAGEKGISATVDIVQPLGDEQIVDLSLKDGTVIKMIAPLELKLARADKLMVDFDQDRLSLFDARSERRIE
jgi:hypothetical protein